MSNFLSNLANRSLGKAEAVLPRLPSLFEPLRSAGSPGFDAPPLEAQEIRDAPPAAQSFRQPLETTFPAPVRQTIAPMPRVDKNPRRELPAEQPPRISRPPAVESTRTKAPNPVVPAVEATAPSKMGEALVFRERKATREIRPTVHDAIALPVPPRAAGNDIAAEAPRPVIEVRTTISDKPATREESQPRFRRRDDPEIQPAPPSPISADAPMPVLIPKIIPRAESPGPAISQVRTRHEESVIHVTIGRIEVRAVSLQTPTPKEKPASSVTSLNEYLRQRSKRGEA